ncbi:zinc-dependent alcohol dehydrogenase [Verrucomicrobiota bacterium sgz303538]
MRGIVFRPEFPRLLLALVSTRLGRSIPLFPGGPVSLESLPLKELPGSHWVRVRSRLAGICGTDLNLLRLKLSTKSATMARERSTKTPKCLGHEVVGEVLEVGHEVQALSPGQRVVLIPGACCSGLERIALCPMCEQGLPLLCLHRDDQVLSPNAGGGWSTEFVRHESELFPVPDDITDEEAVLIEPLACSLHAVLRRPPSLGDTVIVVGCGTIGLGMIMALRALAIPLKIIAISRYEFQSRRATEAGADVVVSSASEDAYERLAAELNTEVLVGRSNNRMLKHGAAVTYDAVGSGNTLHNALRWTRPRGAVVVEGITSHATPFDSTPVWFREIDLVGAHGHGIESYEGRKLHTFQLVIELMRQQRITPKALITHCYPLRDYKTAICTASGKAGSEAIKVLLQMPEHD